MGAMLGYGFCLQKPDTEVKPEVSTAKGPL